MLKHGFSSNRTLASFSACAALLSVAGVALAGGHGHEHAGDKSHRPITVAVYGDSPYGTTPTDTVQFDESGAFIDSINADEDVSLVLHVGDIHSGKQYCTQNYDLSVFDLWTSFEDPMVYTPGDNEWTDCHKVKEGSGAYDDSLGEIVYGTDDSGELINYEGGNPLANLELIRDIFFSNPGYSLGQHPMRVFSQALHFDRRHPSDAQFVENVMFTKADTLFVSINLPGGSNNDTDIWYGTPSMSDEQALEVEERTGADLRFLEAAFKYAKRHKLSAVVIQEQADMWDNEKGPEHQAGYEPFVAKIAEETLAFGRPVLMLNGDSHEFLSDNPLAADDPLNFVHPGFDVPNFHRIVVHGSTEPLEWLRLTIKPGKKGASDSSFGPFSWERVSL